jgi:hypothetical protein
MKPKNIVDKQQQSAISYIVKVILAKQQTRSKPKATELNGK